MINHFKRELLISASVLFGGMLVVSIGLYWLSSDLSDLAGKIVIQRTLIAQQSRAVADFAQLKKDSTMAKTYKQAMSALLVGKDQLFDFPNWLNGLALARQVDITFSADNIPVEPTDSGPGYNGFSIRVDGSLQNDIDFIRDIESRAPKFLVNLTSFDVTNNGSSYEIKSHGDVYFSE